MGNFDGVAEGDQGGVLLILREKDGGEILIGDSGPLEGAGDGAVSADFLDREALDLVVVLIHDLAGGILRGGHVCAETGGPHGEGGDLCAVDFDRRRHLDHITASIEGEGLPHRDAAVIVLEADLSGSGDLVRERKGAGDIGLAVSGQQRTHIQRGVHLVTQLRVVGPQRQRISILLRGFSVYQLELAVFVVGIFLEHPGFDAGSAIGEDDAVDVVLNYCL